MGGVAMSLSLGDDGAACSGSTPRELATAEALASQGVVEVILRSSAERRAGSRNEPLPKAFRYGPIDSRVFRCDRFVLQAGV